MIDLSIEYVTDCGIVYPPSPALTPMFSLSYLFYGSVNPPSKSLILK
jgi:hypothetical protein